jgi:hypothetical protein
MLCSAISFFHLSFTLLISLCLLASKNSQTRTPCLWNGGQQRSVSRQYPANGIGRPIPSEEWRRFLPGTPEPAAAYEPADLFLFSPVPLEDRYGKPYEVGAHGLWPGPPDYRAVFLLWGPGIAPGRTAELPMTVIYQRPKTILFALLNANHHALAVHARPR